MNKHRFQTGFFGVAALLFALVSLNVQAQDLEPRRWTHMPTGLNVIGLGTGYTTGDLYFDPVLKIEEAEFELASAGLVYLRTFGLGKNSARIDFTLPYASGRWEGLLDGEPAKVRRRGFTDPRVRLSYLLYGAPAQTPAEFMKSEKSNTVVGIAVAVKIPWGEYYEDKLINLGSNRWMIRPQLGVTHTRGKWTFELTGSAYWYSDNNEFFNESRLENDILYAGQVHAIYTFKPGLWMSLSTAYGNGADAYLNDTPKELKVDNWLSALSFGLPINRQQGLKFAYLMARSQNEFGADLNSYNVAWSMVF